MSSVHQSDSPHLALAVQKKSPHTGGLLQLLFAVPATDRELFGCAAAFTFSGTPAAWLGRATSLPHAGATASLPLLLLGSTSTLGTAGTGIGRQTSSGCRDHDGTKSIAKATRKRGHVKAMETALVPLTRGTGFRGMVALDADRQITTQERALGNLRTQKREQQEAGKARGSGCLRLGHAITALLAIAMRQPAAEPH